MKLRMLQWIGDTWTIMARHPIVSSMFVILTGMAGLVILTLVVDSEQKQRKSAQQAEKLAQESQAEIARENTPERKANHAAQMDSAIEAWRRHDYPRVIQRLRQVPLAHQQNWEVRHLNEISQRLVQTIIPETNISLASAYSPDRKTIFISEGELNQRPKLIFYDAQSGQPRLSTSGHAEAITSAEFTPDSKRLVTGSYDCTIKIWDVDTGHEIRSIAVPKNLFRGLTLSRDGKMILSGGGMWRWKAGDLMLWDAETGNLIRQFTGHRSTINAVRFSPDGKSAMTGGGDYQIIHWDVATGKILHTYTGHNGIVDSIDFSPDGLTMVSCSFDNRIKIWDINTGKVRFTLKGHTNHPHLVRFHPDGKTIVSVGLDDTVRLWDALLGKALVSQHIEGCSHASFSPDGESLLTVSMSGPVQRWNVAAMISPEAPVEVLPTPRIVP